MWGALAIIWGLRLSDFYASDTQVGLGLVILVVFLLGFFLGGGGINLFMDLRRAFARFALLYGITANVNVCNSTVPEEYEGGKWLLLAVGRF